MAKGGESVELTIIPLDDEGSYSEQAIELRHALHAYCSAHGRLRRNLCFFNSGSQWQQVRDLVNTMESSLEGECSSGRMQQIGRSLVSYSVKEIVSNQYRRLQCGHELSTVPLSESALLRLTRQFFADQVDDIEQSVVLTSPDQLYNTAWAWDQLRNSLCLYKPTIPFTSVACHKRLTAEKVAQQMTALAPEQRTEQLFSEYRERLVEVVQFELRQQAVAQNSGYGGSTSQFLSSVNRFCQGECESVKEEAKAFLLARRC